MFAQGLKEFESPQVSGINWWANLDSNQGPQSYQDCALTG